MASSWYRLEFHTLRRGEGGTDADIVYTFGGTMAGTPWIELTSPGDSHEQGDIDLYYVGSQNIGEFNRWNIHMKSRAQGGVDNWSYKLWIDEYNESSGQWRNIFFIERTSYVSGTTLPDRVRTGVSVHIDAEDPGNPLVDRTVPTPFDVTIHRPFDS